MTNGAATFIAVCLGILTLEMTVVLGALVFLGLRVSRAVQSVERLAYSIEEKVATFKTGWIRAFQGLGGLVTGFVGARKHARREDREPAGRY